jgi:hypothetical protein
LRRLGTLSLLLCALVFAAEPAAAPNFFKYVREMKTPSPEGQAYFVLDRVMWENTRRDLGDIRIYAAGTEVPYSLQVQRGGRSLEQSAARLYDLAASGAATEFKLEPDAAEYDSIHFDLKSRNFVTQATVEASEDGSRWSKLATGTIFDFTDEKLGSNFDVKLPSAARFRRLRVAIADHVPVKDVQGASMAMVAERGASWMTMPAEPKITQAGKETVVEWDSSAAMPLERVQFEVGDPNLNFARAVTLRDAGGQVIATGELTRVHLKREGRSIDREELGIDVSGAGSKHFKLTIQNGDDRGLPITRVLPLSYERRVYFDPQGKTALQVYFGDEKVGPPVYDYARFFHEDAKAQAATLEPSSANPNYTGRADDRPWSERNKWVLWVVMIVAVLGLGAVAVRGMRNL